MKTFSRANALIAVVAASFLTCSAAFANGFANDHGSEVKWNSSIECTNVLGGSHTEKQSQDFSDFSLGSESHNTSDDANSDYTSSHEPNYPCDNHSSIAEGIHISYTDCFQNPCGRVPNQGGQAPVPEPGTLASVLTGLGLAAVGLIRRRR